MAKITDIQNIIGEKARPVMQITEGATALKEEGKNTHPCKGSSRHQKTTEFKGIP